MRRGDKEGEKEKKEGRGIRGIGNDRKGGREGMEKGKEGE